MQKDIWLDKEMTSAHLLPLPHLGWRGRMVNMSLLHENNCHVTMQLANSAKYFALQLSRCKHDYKTLFFSAFPHLHISFQLKE